MDCSCLCLPLCFSLKAPTIKLLIIIWFCMSIIGEKFKGYEKLESAKGGMVKARQSRWSLARFGSASLGISIIYFIFTSLTIPSFLPNNTWSPMWLSYTTLMLLILIGFSLSIDSWFLFIINWYWLLSVLLGLILWFLLLLLLLLADWLALQYLY